MKTIIHIGQHKTGTTSIQHFLRDHRLTLAQNGLYVPSGIAGYTHPSHFILNVYALGEARYSSKKEEIIANKGKEYLSELEIDLKRDIEVIYNNAVDNNCNEVIWSNEGLYLLNTVAEYKRLAALFSEHSKEIEVVCCFRDVALYRASYIKQQRKLNLPPSTDPDSYRYLEPDSWLFDYQRKKNLLSEAFDKCTYFEFDSTDNVSVFMKTIGYSIDEGHNYRLNVTDKA